MRVRLLAFIKHQPGEQPVALDGELGVQLHGAGLAGDRRRLERRMFGIVGEDQLALLAEHDVVAHIGFHALVTGTAALALLLDHEGARHLHLGQREFPVGLAGIEQHDVLVRHFGPVDRGGRRAGGEQAGTSGEQGECHAHRGHKSFLKETMTCGMLQRRTASGVLPAPSGQGEPVCGLRRRCTGRAHGQGSGRTQACAGTTGVWTCSSSVRQCRRHRAARNDMRFGRPRRSPPSFDTQQNLAGERNDDASEICWCRHESAERRRVRRNRNEKMRAPDALRACGAPWGHAGSEC